MALPFPHLSFYVVSCCLFFLITSCRKDDGGIESQLISTGTSDDLTSITKGDGQTLFLTSSNNTTGSVLRSEDGGYTWQTMNNFGYGLNDIHYSSGKLYAVGDSFNLFYSADNGVQWEEIWLVNTPSLEYQAHLRDVQSLNGTIMFCGGWNFSKGVIGISRDAGINWQYFTCEHELRSLVLIDSLHAICAGYGALYITSNGGAAWQQLNANNLFWTSMTVNNGIVYASSYDGTIMTSNDKGISWSYFNRDRKLLSNGYVCISGNSDADLLIGGMNGRGFYSVDGLNWSAVSGFDKSHLYALLMTEKGQGIAAAENGRLYRFSIGLR